MLEYEQYRLDLSAMSSEIGDLYEALGLSRDQEALKELEEQSAAPGFYDNMENSQKVLQKISNRF